MALIEALSTEEQAQLDAMRAADSAPIASAPEPVAPEPVTPASEPTAIEPAAAEPAVAEEPKMVRQEALREERDRRKDADQRNKVLEERLNMLIQRFPQPQAQPAAPQQPAAPEIPDVNKDPMGHLVGVLQSLGLNQQQIQQQVDTQRRQQEQAAVAQGIWIRAQAKETEYKIANPDYDAAVQHTMQRRNRQLELQGMRDAAARQQQIMSEGLYLAAFAEQNNLNFPEVLYQQAREIYGYATPAAAAPVPVEPAVTEPAAAAERLQTLAAGQQQSRSLGNVRGNAPPATPPAQRLIEMPYAEFAAMLDKATPEKLREMFGG